MQFLMLSRNYFSKEVGGGDLGVATGIVHNTMITDGLIIVILHHGMEVLAAGKMMPEVAVVVPGRRVWQRCFHEGRFAFPLLFIGL